MGVGNDKGRDLGSNSPQRPCRPSRIGRRYSGWPRLLGVAASPHGAAQDHRRSQTGFLELAVSLPRGWDGSYFFSYGYLTVGAGEAGVAGAPNGTASPARRWRRVSPISEKTLPQTAFSFLSVVSARSLIRVSDCLLSLVTVV